MSATAQLMRKRGPLAQPAMRPTISLLFVPASGALRGACVSGLVAGGGVCARLRGCSGSKSARSFGSLVGVGIEVSIGRFGRCQREMR